MKASIVYWYGRRQLRRDGGGLRALAWAEALEALGYDAEIVPLWTMGGSTTAGGRLSRAKRALVPMPFARDLPDEASNADLVIATVPATFASALSRVSGERLILDWMDLWSTNAQTLGAATRLSRPGGFAQSRLWSLRERNLAKAEVRAQTYAGWCDFAALDSIRVSRGAWLPTPVESVARFTSSSDGIESVGFLGNLDYPPNRLSLRRFLETHGEALSRLGIRVVVAGFGSTMVSDWGYEVEVLGEVADVRDFYARIDAAVVPVDFGGGIKVKAVEALSYGLPVLATPHVRDGFSPEFWPFLADLDSFVKGELEAVSTVPEDVFSSTFSVTAFRDSVRSLLGPVT